MIYGRELALSAAATAIETHTYGPRDGSVRVVVLLQIVGDSLAI